MDIDAVADVLRECKSNQGIQLESFHSAFTDCELSVLLVLLAMPALANVKELEMSFCQSFTDEAAKLVGGEYGTTITLFNSLNMY